ncbi:hypothetical protein AB0383_19580 [Amycolatopsis sp. NPDC051373]|uniref:hypothetical protein n=1 Tax=Amycolatopsis sp. NPDC051373 TaxID=3155801 RepID=UPI00344EE1D1
MHTSEVVDLLGHVVRREAVTRKPGAIGTKSGFGSRPPIDLNAFEAQERLVAAMTWRRSDLADARETALTHFVERFPRVPLGECPTCSTPVSAEFDQVAVECGECGDRVYVADAVAAARGYVTETWLTAAEVERETATWGAPVTAGRVRVWRHRGLIAADEHGRYLLADVLAVLDRVSGFDRHLSAA